MGVPKKEREIKQHFYFGGENFDNTLRDEITSGLKYMQDNAILLFKIG